MKKKFKTIIIPPVYAGDNSRVKDLEELNAAYEDGWQQDQCITTNMGDMIFILSKFE